MPFVTKLFFFNLNDTTQKLHTKYKNFNCDKKNQYVKKEEEKRRRKKSYDNT